MMKPAFRLLSLIAFAVATGLWVGSWLGAPPAVDVTPSSESVPATHVASSSTAITTRSLAEQVHQRLTTAGGCTLDPRSGQTIGSVDAYAVSLPGYEVRFAACPSVAQVEQYLRRHAVDLEGNRAIYVGAWRDEQTGLHYLDLSELIPDRAVAEHRGRTHLQQCIYHLSTGQEIRLR